MTDNEIIKALECCSVHPMKCKKCPYQGLECCTNEHRKNALDLINRQKAEIERLEKGSLKEAMIFNSKTIENATAEAIKEFAEMITNRASAIQVGDISWVWQISQDDIDSILKEMVGDTE